MSALRSLLRSARNLVRSAANRDGLDPLQEVVNTLREVPIFQHFPRGVLYDLAELVHLRTYKRDEFIYYERDPGIGFYIVQHGRVRLLTEDGRGVHELRQVSEYELFGELSVLGDFRRMETAQAVTEVEVLGFFSPDLTSMLKRNPRAGADVLAALARYVAARQVALVERIAERSGKVEAMQMLDAANPHAR